MYIRGDIHLQLKRYCCDHGITIVEANFFDEINADWRELDYTELDVIKENNKQDYLNELVDYYNAMY